MDDLREWVDTQPALANSSELEKKLLMLMKYVCSEDTCINEYYLTMEQYLLICLVLEGEDLACSHPQGGSVGGGAVQVLQRRIPQAEEANAPEHRALDVSSSNFFNDRLHIQLVTES